MLCPCSSFDDEEKLSFTIDSREYAVPLSKLKRQFTGNLCILPITAIDQDRILLGLPFLREFYSVFDSDNARIGLAPLSEVSCLEDQLDNPNSGEEKKWLWLALFILAGAIFLVLLVTCLIIWIRRCRLVRRYLPKQTKKAWETQIETGDTRRERYELRKAD